MARACALIATACGCLVGADGRAQASQTPVPPVHLDVPYIPQTEALCGGAAAAMLARYWGERHATIEPYAPLVDRRAGGIPDDRLMEALRARAWTVSRLDGSMSLLRDELLARRPPMVLVEDRPQRYHYLVVVGIDDAGVTVHDPTWGPSRTIPTERFDRAWVATARWTLRVSPSTAMLASLRERSTSAPSATHQPPRLTAPRDRCAEQLDNALDAAVSQGLGAAEPLLVDVTRTCQDRAAPWRELGLLRFAQRRWDDAADAAAAALARDPEDTVAVDTQGSALFMAGRPEAALRAWNRSGRPRVDAVHIAGAPRTRQAMLAAYLDLQPGALLTARDFARARRRLAMLPDAGNTRLGLVPGPDGYAVVDAVIAERGSLPRGLVPWTLAGIQAGVTQSVTIGAPVPRGQGETVSGRVGWWQRRPSASVAFSAPRSASPRGIWTVGLAWDRQEYGRVDATQVETHLEGTLGFSSWLTGQTRVDVAVGPSAWRTDGRTRRALRGELRLAHRLFDDRLSIRAELARWAGSARDTFGTASLGVSLRTDRTAAHWRLLADAGATRADVNAPLSLWSGAGEGQARGPLLRAHALLQDGRVDGPVFGRQLTHASAEGQHWWERPRLVRLGAAAFVDVARASGRLPFAAGHPSQVDVGVGLRVRAPGRDGEFALDVAHGLRDGRRAFVASWRAAAW